KMQGGKTVDSAALPYQRSSVEISGERLLLLLFAGSQQLEASSCCYTSFRDHDPISPGEIATPFAATTSSRIRCARFEISTSVAVVIFNFSITGKRLLTTSATSSYAGESGPPPTTASIRIDGPGSPAAKNTEYISRPSWVRAPVALSVCLIQPT